MSEIRRRIQIQPIRRKHDRTGFDCGHPFLNEYLRQFARQNTDNSVAKAYVAVPEDRCQVLGYYTIMAGEIGFESIPNNLRRRLPKYPIPAARIGEFAVDNRSQGMGVGGILLLDAFERITSAARELAVWAVVVDPIDQQAANFYQHFGFEPLLDSDTLFLTLRDLDSWL